MTRTRWLAVFVGAAIVAALAISNAVAAKAPSASTETAAPDKSAIPFFPLAVWLQDPKQAAAYKAVGINTYVGLWEGPTEGQLAALKAAGMRVICEQNDVGLRHKDDPTIVAWMHGDEPDNAQSLPGGKGYGPPILPEKIVAGYQKMRQADPSRPIMLNLGQGVAWDGYIGRGTRTNHPEDYPEYMKGGDIISFDIYPVARDKDTVQGKLEFVSQGVERLVKWGGGHKQIWNCIECTRIQSDHKATPAQVRSEVWMSLIAGSQGIIYFVHEWKPKFNEHALLDDPAMLKEVTAINKEIAMLAPVLNSSSLVNGFALKSSKDDVPVQAMARFAEGATYVFAAAQRSGETQATFTVPTLPAGAAIEVIGEGRVLKPAGAGKFEDTFGPYAVHLYRLQTAQ
jgi:hypothetical protein